MAKPPMTLGALATLVTQKKGELEAAAAKALLQQPEPVPTSTPMAEPNLDDDGAEADEVET
eukprot:681141-Amphidinium_carterae.1